MCNSLSPYNVYFIKAGQCNETGFTNIRISQTQRPNDSLSEQWFNTDDKWSPCPKSMYVWYDLLRFLMGKHFDVDYYRSIGFQQDLQNMIIVKVWGSALFVLENSSGDCSEVRVWRYKRDLDFTLISYQPGFRVLIEPHVNNWGWLVIIYWGGPCSITTRDIMPPVGGIWWNDSHGTTGLCVSPSTLTNMPNPSAVDTSWMRIGMWILRTWHRASYPLDYRNTIEYSSIFVSTL